MRETSPLDQFISQQLAHGRYHSQGMLAHTSQSQTRLSPPLPTEKRNRKTVGKVRLEQVRGMMNSICPSISDNSTLSL